MTRSPNDGGDAGLRPLADVAADVCEGLARSIHDAANREAVKAYVRAVQEADAVLAVSLSLVARLREKAAG